MSGGLTIAATTAANFTNYKVDILHVDIDKRITTANQRGDRCITGRHSTFHPDFIFVFTRNRKRSLCSGEQSSGIFYDKYIQEALLMQSNPVSTLSDEIV